MTAGHRARDQHDEFGVAGIMFEDQRRMRVAKRFELFINSLGTIGGLAARARILDQPLEPARIALEIGGEGPAAAARSEARRVGEEGVSTCRSRGSPCH